MYRFGLNWIFRSRYLVLTTFNSIYMLTNFETISLAIVINLNIV